MSTQKQLSRTTGTERMFKEELALSLICWVFTSPFTNWTDKVFSGIEVPSEGPSSLRGETEKFFLKWFTEFGHLNRGDMLTSEQHRCHNEKKKFQRRV